MTDTADTPNAPWIDLCPADHVGPGEATTVLVEGRPFCVANDAGRFSVVDNTCPHAGGSLGAGYVSDGHVVCPWHHWPWNLETGQTDPSLPMRVGVYECKVEAGRVLARIPKPAGDTLSPDERDLDAQSDPGRSADG